MEYIIIIFVGIIAAIVYSRSKTTQLTAKSQAIQQAIKNLDNMTKELETKSIKSTESYRRIRDEYIKKSADFNKLRGNGDDGGSSAS